MKKLLTILAVTFLCANSFAQIPVRWNVEAGLNSAKVTGDINPDSKTGFNVGVRGTSDLKELSVGMLYGNAGALISLEGYKLLGAKASPCFLELPVHAGISYPLNADMDLFGEAGPYIALGLFGKVDEGDLFEEFDDYLEVSEEETSSDYFEDGMNRLDIGLGLRAGLEIQKKYFFALGYDFGLLKIEQDANEYYRNLYFSVGFYF